MPSLNAKFKPTNHKSSSQVISEVAFELFSKQESFDFLVLGKFSRITNDAIKEVRQRRGDNEINLKYFHSNSYDKWVWTGKGALVFLEEFSAVGQFFKDLNVQKFDKPKLLIYISKAENFEKIKEKIFTQKFNFNFLLLESKKKIELKTFEMWTEKACNVEQLVTLNVFDKKSKKWRKPLQIQEKFTNFHGCPIKIFTNVYELPSFDLINAAGMAMIDPIIEPFLAKRNVKVLELMRIYAGAGNFTAITGKSEYEKYNVVLWLYYYYGNWSDHMSCSMSVRQNNIKFMYSPPEPYTNYEKMILPFDYETWIYLILVFCSAFVGIFVINQMHKRFRDIIYGKDVKTPSLNVLRSFFGIALTKLPSNNFARIILMTFLWFCLIFRTAYQGEETTFILSEFNIILDCSCLFKRLLKRRF